MTDEPDPAVIARRYVNLWQRQLSGLAPDPSVSDAAALYLRSLMGLTAPGRTDGTVRGRHGEHRRERSEEHTSEIQSLMRISYAVFGLKKKKIRQHNNATYTIRNGFVNDTS